MTETTNTRLLFDAYNIYYNKGIEALQNRQYAIAARNLYGASETLLKLAKDSTGELKATRTRRADEIYSLAEQVEKKSQEILNGYGKNMTGAKDDLAKLGINYDSSNKSSSSSSKGKGGNEDDTLSTFAPVSDTGVSLDDVAGLEEAKEEINQKVIEPNKHPEIFERFNKAKGGGILLYGVPGTGKTMLAQAIAHEIDAKFFSVRCSDILSKWVGDAEQNIRNLFAEAKKYPNSIIFFDEFEALGTKRDTYSTVMKRVVPELLTQIQGFEKNKNNLIVIAATNRPWDIDSAFLRPGRFDRRIYVPLPDEATREAMIRNKLRNVPVASDLNFEGIVEMTEGFNGADVTAFCEKLKDLAISREIRGGQKAEINNSDVQIASRIIFSSVQAEDLQKFAKYQESLNRGVDR